MGGAIPFHVRDLAGQLGARAIPGVHGLLDVHLDWRATEVTPTTPLKSGPYRHAYGLTDGGPWSLGELASVGDGMIEGSNGVPPRSDVQSLPSAYTYFGQLVVHDLSRMSTLDPLLTATAGAAGSELINRCRPRLDLHSLYGLGPLESPEYYLPSRIAPDGRLAHWHARETRYRSPGSDDDLLRNLHGSAILPEARNDENVIVSQVHLALLKAHNRAMADPLLAVGNSPRERFRSVRRLMRWHVQWLVLNDFLKRILHAEQARLLSEHLDHFENRTPPHLPFVDEWRDDPWMPLEFVLAAYRFGHALARPAYRLNETIRDPVRLLREGHEPEDQHLGGGRMLRVAWTLDWNHFCDDRRSSRTQYARPFAPRVSPSLGALPLEPFHIDGGGRVPDEHLSKLPYLTLFRGALFGLPTGQDLAAALARRDSRIATHTAILAGRAPLWHYLLAEAEHAGEGGGRTLGRLGSTIVLDTLLGLIAADPESYLQVEPGWKPCMGKPETGKPYSLGTLLRYAWPKSHGGDLA